MIRFIIGRAGVGKSTFVQDEVCRVMGIGPDRRPLYNELLETIEDELVAIREKQLKTLQMFMLISMLQIFRNAWLKKNPLAKLLQLTDLQGF